MELLSERRLGRINRAVVSGRILPYVALVDARHHACRGGGASASGPGEFDSFGDSLWWAAQTVTTVGYGDVIPETPSARRSPSFVMFFGVAAVSLITAIVTSAFMPRHRTSPGGEVAARGPAPRGARAHRADASPRSRSAPSGTRRSGSRRRRRAQRRRARRSPTRSDLPSTIAASATPHSDSVATSGETTVTRPAVVRLEQADVREAEHHAGRRERARIAGRAGARPRRRRQHGDHAAPAASVAVAATLRAHVGVDREPAHAGCREPRTRSSRPAPGRARRGARAPAALAR